MPDESKPPAYEDQRGARPSSGMPTEPALHEARRDPYAAFRSRGFGFFVAGNFLFVLGREMLAVGVGWEVYQRTRSAFALGLVGLAAALPTILLALPAGQLADRFPRRTVLLVTQLVSALSSAGLAFVSHAVLDVKWIFALLFCTAAARTFNAAVRGPFMVNLVPEEAINNAVTWNSSVLETATVIGPALAGLTLAHFPYWLVYAGDACCGLIFFVLLLPIRVDREKPRGAPAGLAGLFSGLRFVFATKIILATITMDLFAVLFGGAVALLPIYADRILHVGPVGLGWLRAAPAFGAILMALTLTHLPPMRRPGRTMLAAVALFGAVTIVFGASRSFPLSLLMLGISGACDNISVVVRHTLVQLLTPDAMRGRVSAVNNVFIGSSNELGAFESGVTAAWLGPVLSVVLGGVATIFTVAWVGTVWKEVWALGSFESIRRDFAERE